jgi:hypothetical protein
MRNWFVVIVASLFISIAGTAALAQSHDNMKEKKASDELTISRDMLVSGHLLKAGRYLIECDRVTIKFYKVDQDYGGVYVTRTKVLEMPCQGNELDAKRTSTELTMPVNKDGVAVLEKLLLRGSNVEHVFPAS